MSLIIAAKYGGPCIKCGKKIKAGSFVNWDRGRGIWHLDETDNKKLSFSMLDPSHVENGCHPKAGGLPTDAHHKEEKTVDSEEKIMGSNNNDDTISVNDLIEALRGMAGKEVAKTPAKADPLLAKLVARERPLTDKQLSFCELMALGSNRADAYTDSYNVSNPAFSNNAARRLLNQKKIRDQIAKFINELGDIPAGFHRDIEVTKPTGRAERGWEIKLTGKQENFCQARAGGSTIVEAFKESGYHTVYWTERRIRKAGNRLMRMPKIKNRITDIESGCAPDIKVLVAGEDSHKVPRTGSVRGPIAVAEVEEVSTSDPLELNEFVDNFVELIKAHGRLFHHAVVTRGQEEVGIAGADVKGVEEAVERSIEALRETLKQKLLRDALTVVGL
tara:strand:- start:1190 stop:2356 length:1167 start_codon:yes stop_codon:yes gene_type:complete